MTMEAFVELIKNSGVADKSSKGLRQDIYSFITRIGEFLLMGTLDLCIDKQLMSQALRLSREPLIQEVLAQEITKTLGVCENRVRLLSNIETILSHDYYPSPEDILSTRKPTKGYHEFLIESDRFLITLVDVGGERSERKKWLSCFESVNAVLFVASMAEYDLCLPEDPKTNQLIDSLKLFESICNLKWFTHTALLLFLNKKDIFLRKIQTIPLTVCFSDYDGPPRSYENASDYIWQQYEKQCKLERCIYRHFTCAKDRRNISVVFSSVTDYIQRSSVKDLGLT